MQTWQEIYRQNVQSHQINTKSILSNHYTTPVKSENIKLESTINFVKAMEKCLDTKPAEILKKKVWAQILRKRIYELCNLS